MGVVSPDLYSRESEMSIMRTPRNPGVHDDYSECSVRQDRCSAVWVQKPGVAGNVRIDDVAIAAFVKASEFNGQAPPQHAVQQP